MHYEGITWRPPFEADSLLLQVTTGCSHNKCAFCTMYSDVEYKVSPMSEIDEDIAEARRTFNGRKRVFLENGDAFSLSADRLARIAEKINVAFDDFSYISCYASIKNIKDKTVEQLKQLKDLKFDRLNVGVESALDDVLTYLNKGFTSAEAYEQLDKLNQAGIKYCLNFIIGSEGFGNYRRSAEANAEMVNRLKPYMIFVGTLHYEEGCRLYDDIKNGVFKENTLRQIMTEELEFIKGIKSDTIFFGTHPSNALPLCGVLPRDGEKLVGDITSLMAQISPSVLDSVPAKGEEGELSW